MDKCHPTCPPLSVLSVPLPPIRFAAGLVEDTAKACGYRPPINRATVDKYMEDIAVRGEKIRTMLGFKPEYDLVFNWNETIQEMRRNGNL